MGRYMGRIILGILLGLGATSLPGADHPPASSKLSKLRKAKVEAARETYQVIWKNYHRARATEISPQSRQRAHGRRVLPGRGRDLAHAGPGSDRKELTFLSAAVIREITFFVIRTLYGTGEADLVAQLPDAWPIN